MSSGSTVDDGDGAAIVAQMEREHSDDEGADADEQQPIQSLGMPERQTVSTNRTLMNFLRSMIGPGCLALPVAVKKSGLWGGLILIFVLGYLNTHCCLVLVETAQYLCRKSGRAELDYGHLAKKAVDFGPFRFRHHSKKALYLANAVIVALQLGICSVQLVFMASHIVQVVNELAETVEISVLPCMAVLVLPVVLFNYIRSVHVLSLFSTLANLLMLIVFAIIFYAIMLTPQVPGPRAPFTNAWNSSMAVGAIMYAFEGQAVILPLENRMTVPGDMVGPTGVLFTGMNVVIALYAATGFMGYYTYGEQVQPSITLSLSNTVLYDMAKLLLVVGVFVGYGLQLYVVIAMLWPPIKRKWMHGLDAWHLTGEYVFRTTLVLVTFAIAALVPNLDTIISLVGISAGVLIAFVLPALLQLVVYWDDWAADRRRWYKWAMLAKDLGLVAIGLFGGFFGLYSTIVEIVEAY